MKRGKAFIFSILFLVCALTAVASGGQAADGYGGQAPVKHKSKAKADDLLRRERCKAQRLSAVPLTYLRSAAAVPIEETLSYEDWLETLRGEYLLDRSSAEEYVIYPAASNYFKHPRAAVRINPCRNSLPKKE